MWQQSFPAINGIVQKLIRRSEKENSDRKVELVLKYQPSTRSQASVYSEMHAHGIRVHISHYMFDHASMHRIQRTALCGKPDERLCMTEHIMRAIIGQVNSYCTEKVLGTRHVP